MDGISCWGRWVDPFILTNCVRFCSKWRYPKDVFTNCITRTGVLEYGKHCRFDWRAPSQPQPVLRLHAWHNLWPLSSSWLVRHGNAGFPFCRAKNGNSCRTPKRASSNHRRLILTPKRNKFSLVSLETREYIRPRSGMNSPTPFRSFRAEWFGWRPPSLSCSSGA